LLHELLLLAASGAGFVLVGCTADTQGTPPLDGPPGSAGSVGSAGAAGFAGSAGAAGGSSQPFDTSQCKAPPSRVVRLSKLELQSSIDDLLGKPSKAELPEDAKFLSFSSNAEALVTPPFGNALQSAAAGLAADFSAALDTAKLGSDCAKDDAAARVCANAFITTYGQKAFRRPLAQADVDGLLSVYDAGRETGDAGDFQSRLKAGLDYTLQAILQSPHFVYRIELGDASAPSGGVVALSAYESASALSYLLTASPPDEALLAAAAAGKLDTPEALEGQARRLLASMSERFAAQESRFVREWLGINFTTPAWDKNETIYPLYSPKLKTALEQETSLFIGDWATGASSLSALLTSSSTFVNDVNGPVYGLTGSAGSMKKLALDPQQRSGILTMAGFLGSHAHTDSSAPILRGISVARALLCATIAPPPPNVPPLPPVSDMTYTTTRDRVEKHVAVSATCMACHSQINPMGYPFESYDGLGVYRTEENGYPVDPSGAIVGAGTSAGPVANAIELTAALASSPEVQDCFSRQVFRNAFGRDVGVADECTVRDAREAFKAKQLDIKELLIALVKSKTFAQRSTPDVTP
jgi:hypothetical protein